MSGVTALPSNSRIRRAESLSETVYRDLLARLQRGGVGPGDRLVDTEIAAQTGVSRMPVREALLRLVAEGHLVGSTRGFRLPKLADEDIAEIFEIRRLLEPRAAADAARHMTADAGAWLAKALATARAAHAAGDAQALMLANIDFRETWLGAARNRRLAATIATFADQVQTVRHGTLFNRATQAVVMDGLDGLYEAFAAREPVAAMDRMASFIAKAEEHFFAARRQLGVMESGFIEAVRR